MEITSIFLVRLPNGNYRNPNKPNEEISAKAVGDCMDAHSEIPGGVRLYYDDDRNVRININLGEDVPNRQQSAINED